MASSIVAIRCATWFFCQMSLLQHVASLACACLLPSPVHLATCLLVLVRLSWPWPWRPPAAYRCVCVPWITPLCVVLRSAVSMTCACLLLCIVDWCLRHPFLACSHGVSQTWSSRVAHHGHLELPPCCRCITGLLRSSCVSFIVNLREALRLLYSYLHIARECAASKTSELRSWVQTCPWSFLCPTVLCLLAACTFVCMGLRGPSLSRLSFPSSLLRVGQLSPRPCIHAVVVACLVWSSHGYAEPSAGPCPSACSSCLRYDHAPGAIFHATGIVSCGVGTSQYWDAPEHPLAAAMDENTQPPSICAADGACFSGPHGSLVEACWQYKYLAQPHGPLSRCHIKSATVSFQASTCSKQWPEPAEWRCSHALCVLASAPSKADTSPVTSLSWRFQLCLRNHCGFSRQCLRTNWPVVTRALEIWSRITCLRYLATYAAPLLYQCCLSAWLLMLPPWISCLGSVTPCVAWHLSCTCPKHYVYMWHDRRACCTLECACRCHDLQLLPRRVLACVSCSSRKFHEQRAQMPMSFGPWQSPFAGVRVGEATHPGPTSVEVSPRVRHRHKTSVSAPSRLSIARSTELDGGTSSSLPSQAQTQLRGSESVSASSSQPVALHAHVEVPAVQAPPAGHELGQSLDSLESGVPPAGTTLPPQILVTANGNPLPLPLRCRYVESVRSWRWQCGKASLKMTKDSRQGPRSGLEQWLIQHGMHLNEASRSEIRSAIELLPWEDRLLPPVQARHPVGPTQHSSERVPLVHLTLPSAEECNEILSTGVHQCM